MATFRYRYTGQNPVHLPIHGLQVEAGQEVHTTQPINHPDFELIEGGEKEEKAKKHRE